VVGAPRQAGPDLLNRAFCAPYAQYVIHFTTVNKTCNNPRLGKLIGMYEFGGLEQSDKTAFLGHLVECEYCDDQAYSMEPVAIAFRKHRTAVQRSRTSTPVLQTRSSEWGVLLWALKRAVPLTVSVLLVVGGALVVWRAPWKPPTQVEVSRWADIKVPKPGYTAPEITVVVREPDTIFVRAMAAYQRDDLDAAIEQLQTLSEMHPSNLGEVSFYEGVSLLLVGRSQDAIAALRRAVETGDRRRVEMSHYYLALAYLKRNQPQQAIADVEAVIESGGEYLTAAKQLREQISDLSGKN
jgi:hypothetical protein